MKIYYVNAKQWGIRGAFYTPFVKRAESVLPHQDGSINVVFVDDKTIHHLNRGYRKKDCPTDVLSFTYSDSPDFSVTRLIGEIFISVETARRQALEFGWGLEDEVAKLLIHGILHLFGFDHEVDEDYAEMSALEKKILG